MIDGALRDRIRRVRILFTGSSASTTVVTSTAMKVGTTPEYHYVTPGSRYIVLST